MKINIIHECSNPKCDKYATHTFEFNGLQYVCDICLAKAINVAYYHRILCVESTMKELPKNSLRAS